MRTIIHIISSLDDGGAEGVLYRLIECSQSEFSHRVICLKDHGKYGDMLLENGVSVTTLNMPAGRLSVRGLIGLFTELKRNKGNKTIVQTWMYHSDLLAGCIARILGYKTVIWGVRNNKIDSASKMTSIIARLCALTSSIVPSSIICCSSEAIDHHRGLGYKGVWHTIPNGYQTDDFTVSTDLRKHTRSELGINDCFLFGFVARWDPQKDHKTLLHAVSLWQKNNSTIDFKLLLVGNEMDENNTVLYEMIRSLQLENKVLLLGRRDDIPGIMNAIDVHILSSKSEAFPNVIAEAMACGTPCVCTDVGLSLIHI